MTRNFLLVAAALWMAAPALAADNPKPAPAIHTVNSYTPAEEARARKAATDAGYLSPVITSAQAGNFFMNASKDGKSYQLTVTPDGKVYAGK